MSLFHMGQRWAEKIPESASSKAPTTLGKVKSNYETLLEDVRARIHSQLRVFRVYVMFRKKKIKEGETIWNSWSRMVLTRVVENEIASAAVLTGAEAPTSKKAWW